MGAEEAKPNGIHETRINADTNLLLTEYSNKYCITSLQFIEIFNLQTNSIKFRTKKGKDILVKGRGGP
jgi:hypothetical protein